MARNVADAARKFLLLGQCVPTVKQNAAKIRVKRLELDENLLMVSVYLERFTNYCVKTIFITIRINFLHSFIYHKYFCH